MLGSQRRRPMKVPPDQATYYDQTIELYRRWSRNFNIHFGYWKWGMNPFDNEAMLQAMDHLVLDALQVDSSRHVKIADMGCGVGAVSLCAARKFPNAELFGVNVSRAHIEFGQKRCREQGFGPERIKFIYADYANTPFREAELDRAFALESSCYGLGNGREPLVGELMRILKPEGRFAVADGFVKKPPETNAVYGLVHHMVCGLWRLKELANIHEFSRALREVGFVNVSVTEISWNLLPSYSHVGLHVLRYFRDLLLGRIRNSHYHMLLLQTGMGVALCTFLGAWRSRTGYFLVTGEKPREGRK